MLTWRFGKKNKKIYTSTTALSSKDKTSSARSLRDKVNSEVKYKLKTILAKREKNDEKTTMPTEHYIVKVKHFTVSIHKNNLHWP